MVHCTALTVLVAITFLTTSVLGHGNPQPHLHKRQSPSSSSRSRTRPSASTPRNPKGAATAEATTSAGPAPPAPTTTPAVVVTPTPTPAAAPPAALTQPPSGQIPMSPLAGLANIGVTPSSEAQAALPTIYTAGQVSPIIGAPVLPDSSLLNFNDYPPLDLLPPINSPQVLQWISEVDLTNIPNIPTNGLNGCQNTTVNQAAITNAGSSGNCWWTCSGCTRATDITYCPTVSDWGVSFDDGPSPDTPRLLNLLNEAQVKSTFFIVGSRAISRPEMLQAEYMLGHQLSVHTWSHPVLTQLTNEQIIAELGWSKKVIKDVTGVTPNTMRPPYGDIDDRVRYIALQMGLTPIIWTSITSPNGGEQSFDTEDFKIGAGLVTATTAYSNFENFLTQATSTMTTGFIVLAHDLYQQSVSLATDYVLPFAINGGQLHLKSIIQCLGKDISEAYIETSSNVTQSLPLVGASGIGTVANAIKTNVMVATTATTTTTTTTTTITMPTTTTTVVATTTTTADSKATSSSSSSSSSSPNSASNRLPGDQARWIVSFAVVIGVAMGVGW